RGARDRRRHPGPPRGAPEPDLPQRGPHAFPGRGGGGGARGLRPGHLRWSALSFEENVQQTRRAVEAIRSIAPSIVVEGELGEIGTGSEILAEAPKGMVAFSAPSEAKEFVGATGVDVLAPAVGNMHGLLASMVRGEAQKRLDIPRIKAIKEEARVPMT